ncbi:MAG: PKD domain-containing protein [Candidatus Promineifilaceae bacterium]
MSRKGVWGRRVTQVDSRLSFGIFVFIALTLIYFGSVRAQSESDKRITLQSELEGELSAECQSSLFKELSEISVHDETNSRLAANLDLIRRCNTELNAAAERSASRMMDRTIAPLEGLINFETPHVHPIDLTPNGNTLLAVNIAAHMLEVYQVSGSQLIHQQSIPVGLDPVSVRARSNTEAWVVNHLSDSVSIVDLTAGTVIRSLETDNEPADVVFAGSPQRAFVTASEADAINVYSLSNLNAAPQTIDIFGEDPRALAVSNDGQTVYAAIFESGNNTRVQGAGANATITRGNTLADNDVAVINANTLGLSFQTGLMTMNMALAVHPTTNNITVVGTESLNDILLEPNVNGIFSRINLASFPQGGSSQLTDLNPHLTYSSPTVAQNLRDQSVGDPRGIAWRSSGTQAFVTGMGSNNVIVVDQTGARVDNIEVGQGPTGIVLKDSANLGFVMNKFDGSISVINLNTRQELSRVAFDDPTPDVIKNGRPFLYDTHETSGLGHVSCASCHVDARTDRLAWDLGVPGGASVTVPNASNSTGAVSGSVSVSSLKGPMVTQSLQDIMEHPILHWRGDRADLGAFNPAFVGLMGDDVELTSAEMQAFGDFLSTIWLQPNPYRNLDDTRPNSVVLPDGRTVTSATMDALRGNNQFNNNCLRCHSGQGNATRNFGANAEIGSNIVSPALPGLYDKMGFGRGTAGFGFFHTGEANVDRAARLSTSEQNEAFLAELMTLGGPSGPLVGAELRQIPHAGVGQQLTINGAATGSQTNLLNQFKSISVNSPFAVLIAKANINGTQRGFVYLGSDNFQTDRQSEQMTLAQLLASAASGDPVTFTLVADGMETRLALDSDLDGIFNGDGALELTSPGNQTNTVGDTVDLTIAGAGADPIVFNSSGLPANLTIASNGRITGSPTTAGSYNVLVWATDDNGSTDSIAFSWTIEAGNTTTCDPGLLHEWWDNIAGVSVSNLVNNPNYPNQPTGSNIRTTFNIPGFAKDAYGVRMQGYIVAPATGAYTFWIASDDGGELWLSSDEQTANKALIASVPSWTFEAEYDKFPSQQSAEISLIAGQRYYVEALMKEWFGGDHLNVAWRTPLNATRTLITSADTCTLELSGTAPVANLSANPTSGTAPLTVSFDASGSSDADGSIVSYAWEFGNGSTASGATVSHTYVNAGVYDVTLTVTDDSGRSDTASTTITANIGTIACAEAGLTYERFDNMTSATLDSFLNDPRYPDSPTTTALVSNFEAPSNVANYYGARVHGFLTAPVSGNYTFWIAGDDVASLQLSSNNNPGNAVEIASVNSWTPQRQWDWHPEQQSAEIALQAGEIYYVSAQLKENGGGDNLAVAWQIPGGSRQLIPNAVLCPAVDNGAPPVAVVSADPTIGDAPLAVNFNGAGSSDADGPIVSYVWNFGDGTSGSGAAVSHSYASAGSYVATLTVTDEDGRDDSAEITILVTTPGGGVACNTNGVQYELWAKIWSDKVSALLNDPRYPDSPDSSSTLNTLVVPSNVGNAYGARMRAYLIAPESGQYTFWVASDNEGQLWLSSNINPSNATMISQVDWSPEQDWEHKVSQQSAEITLIAGEAYYIEGLHQASWGGDYYAVAWDTPSGPRELIPNDALCVIETNGRVANNALADLLATHTEAYRAPVFGASELVADFPLALYPELMLILSGDQPLRERALALRDRFEGLLTGGGLISAEHLNEATAVYDAIYAQASPALQTWLTNHWSRINPDALADMPARNAWQVANTLAPTSVSGVTQSTQSAPTTARIMVLFALLSLTTLLKWRERDGDLRGFYSLPDQTTPNL